MMFVGFLGCYGAIQESQCLLGTVRRKVLGAASTVTSCRAARGCGSLAAGGFSNKGAGRTREHVGGN